MPYTPYPERHCVGLWHPMVQVKDHDSGDDAGGDHEHDAVEVGALDNKYLASRENLCCPTYERTV